MSTAVNPALGSEPSVQLFRLVLVLATHLRTRMDQRLSDVGLTTQQASILTLLEGTEGPPTLGEAARALGTSHQNVRQVVAALERKGMVEVAADPADGRVRRLTLTTRVGEVFAERNPADHREVGEWVSVLTEEEQRQVVGLLGRLLRGLLEEDAAPEARESEPGRATQGPNPEGSGLADVSPTWPGPPV